MLLELYSYVNVLVLSPCYSGIEKQLVSFKLIRQSIVRYERLYFLFIALGNWNITNGGLCSKSRFGKAAAVQRQVTRRP